MNGENGRTLPAERSVRGRGGRTVLASRLQFCVQRLAGACIPPGALETLRAGDRRIAGRA